MRAPTGSGFEGGAWLDACRRMVAGQRLLFEEAVTIPERHHYDGRGDGGDQTLRLDRQCEDIVFAELEVLAEGGLAFTAISEERGTVEFNGGAGLWVVIDPIDGSLNVRRTLPHHSLSVAVATGPDMSQVAFGFVFDFGPGEEFHATAGQGAFLGERRLAVEPPTERDRIYLTERLSPVYRTLAKRYPRLIGSEFVPQTRYQYLVCGVRFESVYVRTVDWTAALSTRWRAAYLSRVP